MEKFLQKKIIEYIERLDSSDLTFMRRIYISLEEYVKEKQKGREE